MCEYTTSQVAARLGVHPNTVRMYEACALIPMARRKENGYRVFTEFHIEQFFLARAALRVEVLQNGLRKQAVAIINTSAAGDFDTAIRIADDYLDRLAQAKQNAKLAIATAEHLITAKAHDDSIDLSCLLQKECAEYLGVTVDTLRNWEQNGLLDVKRKENGYRIYYADDIRRLILIRSLRCANYSLAAILRMLTALSLDPGLDPAEVLNTPGEDEDVISACDRLLSSISEAEDNGRFVLDRLREFKRKYEKSPF